MTVFETVSAADALLIVDVQNDFLPGGSLAIPLGNEILAPLGRYIDWFAQRQRRIYASRDWHPADHCSFHAQGGSWPAHCVQNTPGAAFSTALALPADTVVISKAQLSSQDAYSAFAGTELGQRLKADGVKALAIAGLATDYCVKHTALDALAAGLGVFLLLDAVRPVDNATGDQAIAELCQAGVRCVVWDDLVDEDMLA